MMNEAELRVIVGSITYKPGWTIRLHNDGDRFYVQAEVSTESDLTIDPHGSAERTPWKSGKVYLSQHMCRQEVVGTVWDMIQRAETHEMREWFKYKGASIFNPHLDPDVLADLAKKRSSFIFRKNPMTMEE